MGAEQSQEGQGQDKQLRVRIEILNFFQNV